MRTMQIDVYFGGRGFGSGVVSSVALAQAPMGRPSGSRTGG